MGTTCKGMCIQLKGEPVPNGVKYTLGYKRCSYCQMFMQTSEIRCPCCSTKLRTKPRK